MKPAVVLLAACCLASPMAVKDALAQGKGANRAAEHERKAMEQEVKRQQDFEKKMMEQQRKAMQDQANAEKKFMEAQQRAYQQQQKAAQEQQRKSSQQQAHASSTTGSTPTPAYHATRPYYGHQSYHPHRVSYRHYRQMPTQQDPATLALMHLKRSLDAIKPGSTVTTSQKSAIKNAMMRVVEVPKVPTLAAMTTLSGHLANAMANRGSANAETGQMALTLRGVLNSTDLPNIDLTEFMNEHRAALKVSKVRPTEVTAVMDSLKTVSNQVRSRR